MTADVDHLNAALADRYRIERELGAGGMATVYLAHDVKHDRKVALKVLRPELAAALGHERFLREITTTANLRHPHILPLYDSGRTGGRAGGRSDEFLFYVMPYVEGENLRDRLAREKQLPVDDALQIAREVADALSYAHSRGVIHRDIKPENILLEHGHAVVADFGIARAVDAAGGGQLTETGLAIGTPTYMSPEQAAGEREIDGRSDLYALACVLYEMLAGQAPFTGPTVETVIHQHLMAAPPPVTQFRPAVPADVAAALQRALAKAPADRFNPVAQFSEAIHTSRRAGEVPKEPARPAPLKQRRVPLAAVLTLVAIAAVGTTMVLRRGDGAPAIAASVAVLPFADLSPDRSSEYLGDGIAETLISTLANVPGLAVAARTSAFSFKGRNEDVREIGRELDVATVLEGSVQRAGDQLRVTAQLIKTSDGLHLWSQTFDRAAGDIFAVQDEVARAVVTALRGRLLDEQAGLGTSVATTDRAAYDLYLQGRFFWNKRAVPDVVQAIGYFERAIALDSSYAEAWAGLADAYLVLPFYSDTISSTSAVPRARRAAERALAIKPGLAEAHATLAFVLTTYDWDWEAAEREFHRSIELDPGYVTAHKWYSDLLASLGRYDEALAAARRAAALDPRSPNVRTIVAVRLWALERFDEAEAEFERAFALDPTFPLTLIHSSWFYWTRGDTAAFFSVRERLDAVAERGGVPAHRLRAAYAAGGPDSVLRLQLAAPAARYNPTDRVRARVLLGDLDGAFADLEQAERERTVWLVLLTGYPFLAPLHNDPRYEAFLQRLGAPTTARSHRARRP